jgi:hypothetical protein
MGGILNILLIVGALYLVYRFFVSRRRPSVATPPMQFAGAGGPSFGTTSFQQREPSFADTPRPQALVSPSINVPPGFEIEPFVRQAQSSFLRLQAANDDRDLADLRSTTTAEVYAELAMQIRERGDVPQKTDVVTLDAQLLEVVVDGDQLIASLRYSGTIRESAGAAATPFDEVWRQRPVVDRGYPADGLIRSVRLSFRRRPRPSPGRQRTGSSSLRSSFPRTREPSDVAFGATATRHGIPRTRGCGARRFAAISGWAPPDTSPPSHARCTPR